MKKFLMIAVAAASLSACEEAAPYQVNAATISQSDDFEKNREAFTELANTLIGQGFCTEAEVAEQGGFVKSVLNYKYEPVYFVYCGGWTNENRIYVNTETREMFR
jgi:hypothetical protein